MNATRHLPDRAHAPCARSRSLPWSSSPSPPPAPWPARTRSCRAGCSPRTRTCDSAGDRARYRRTSSRSRSRPPRPTPRAAADRRPRRSRTTPTVRTRSATAPAPRAASTGLPVSPGTRPTASRCGSVSRATSSIGARSSGARRTPSPPNGCYDAETIALDEFGHVEGLDHHVNYADDSDYTRRRRPDLSRGPSHRPAGTRMPSAAATWRPSRCSTTSRAATADVLDLPRPLDRPDPVRPRRRRSRTAARRPSPPTLKVVDLAGYVRLGGNPVSGRKVSLQRRPAGGTTWSTVGHDADRVHVRDVRLEPEAPGVRRVPGRVHHPERRGPQRRHVGHGRRDGQWLLRAHRVRSPFRCPSRTGRSASPPRREAARWFDPARRRGIRSGAGGDRRDRPGSRPRRLLGGECAARRRRMTARRPPRRARRSRRRRRRRDREPAAERLRESRRRARPPPDAGRAAAASLAVEGGDPVAGSLGSYTWAGGGSDSPWLPGAPMRVGSGERLRLTLAPKTGVDSLDRRSGQGRDHGRHWCRSPRIGDERRDRVRRSAGGSLVGPGHDPVRRRPGLSYLLLEARRELTDAGGVAHFGGR